MHKSHKFTDEILRFGTPHAWSVTWARLVAHGAGYQQRYDVDFPPAGSAVSRRLGNGRPLNRSQRQSATTALTRSPRGSRPSAGTWRARLRSQIAPRVPYPAPGGLRRLPSRRSLPVSSPTLASPGWPTWEVLVSAGGLFLSGGRCGSFQKKPLPLPMEEASGAGAGAGRWGRRLLVR